MQDLDTWLSDMCDSPLPGGVAAAAVGAAMGAALIAKALRVTLQRQQLTAAERGDLTDVLNLARTQQAVLSRLADADVEAYRVVLDTCSLADDHPARRQAWRLATEVPLAVAETCSLLLDKVPDVVPQCWSRVCVDFEIGSQFLEVAVRAGVLAAEANLSVGAAMNGNPLRARLDALSRRD